MCVGSFRSHVNTPPCSSNSTTCGTVCRPQSGPFPTASAPPYAFSITNLTASLGRFHVRNSRSSCFRPSFVSE